MKEIFDWLRERIKEESATGFVTRGAGFRYLPTVTAENIITEAEAKWKENESKCEDCAGCTNWKCDCENIRNKAIDEFAEKLKSDYHKHGIVNMLKHGEDYSRYGREKSLDEYIDEIASQMKGEKEC